ncbi:MAG: FtsB family cell division protein [Solirubrobacteraceae bacterium]
MPPATARRATVRFDAIRWDRMGRVALLCVLVGLAFLYIKPLSSYLAARGQAKARDADVRALERERDQLLARRRALKRPAVLEREARRLGYVKPGERSYIVRDLPKGP